jgi:hypothetical protein
MNKHTKGPWRVGQSYGPTVYIEPSVASVNAHKNSRSEIEANARLIAAAPELLEALDALLTAMGDGNGNEVDGVYGNWPEWSPYRELDDAVAVVKKARDGGACS